MVASYERLADSAFAAAMDIQRHLNGQKSSFEGYRELVRLLEEPIPATETPYKLLYDARNLPVYKAAWSTAFGAGTADTKRDAFLKKVSEFLGGTLANIEQSKPFKADDVARFCLALSKSFMNENAKQYNSSYQARMRNATS